MGDQKFNFVTFQPLDSKGEADGPRLYLTLESDFTLSAGIVPNINTAIVPFMEFAKLSASSDPALATPGRRGNLEFWFNNDPAADGAAPDHKLTQIHVIDIEPTRVEATFDDPDQPIVTEWRLYLADLRERFIEPRGGRLFIGVLNKPGEDNPLAVSELVGLCLDAMGIDTDSDLSGLDDLTPPTSVQWLGNHAPTELEKLLSLGLHAFCPQSDGSIKIEQAGQGDEPIIPDGMKIQEVDVSGIDRRGKTVIFTSAPLGTLDTFNIPDNERGIDLDWVILDPNDRWVDSSGRAGDIKNNFADVKPDDQKSKVFQTLYRCLMVRFYAQAAQAISTGDGTGDYSQLSPILRQRLEAMDLTQATNIKVLAKIATQNSDGTWSNATTPIELAPAQITSGDQGTILWMGRLMGQVDADGVNDVPSHFKELANTDADKAILTARVTCELHKKKASDDPSSPASYLPEFVTLGFQQTDSGPVALSDADVQNAIDKVDPDTLFVSRPELRLLRVDGQEANRADITAAATALAPRYLARDGDHPRIISAAGFIAAELGGIIGEIRWNQQAVTTTFKLNTWYTPLSGLLTGQQVQGGAYPGQSQTQVTKIAEGSTAGQQPAVPTTTLATPTPIRAIKDMRWNETSHTIQVVYKENPQEADWIDKVQFGPCSPSA